MIRRSLPTLFCIAALLSSCSGPDPSGPKTLKLGHVLNTDHPVHKGIMKAAELLEEKSGGQLKMTVFHSGSQGTEEQCVQKLGIGTLDLTKVSMAALEAFEPRSRILSFPYLFRDADHYWAVLNGEIGAQLLDVALESNLKGICYFDAGFRSFYTRAGKRVETADDLRGMKIRSVNSETMVGVLASLGCTPTVIEWGELYTSLQNGVVDGAENNIPSLYTSRQFEAVKYYTLNEHTAVPDVIIMSRKAWTALSEEEQAWLRAAFLEAVTYQIELWRQDCEKQLSEMQARGLEVIRPDKSSFIAAAQSFYDRLTDPELVDLVARIRAVP